ncbi:hypothetical protein IQ06DRAFT_60546 [Phaeosphaeriaceae sp. SRC1lsM3a]|nr:hypothetical protein IQ06DRAFT_60546 [Stagonospora sp. SRC1lsM3a]
MKFQNPLLLALPVLIGAVPLTTPNLDPTTKTLLGRDNNCYLNSDALINDPQGCDSTPFSVSRLKDVTGASRFGVRCTARGRSFRGYTKWDYVPGWNCWIWAGWTQEGCESGLPYYDDYRRCL